MVQGEVSHRCVWGPRSLHTAEAIGSKPVTPTSTNTFREPCCGAVCHQIVGKPLTVVAMALWALTDSGDLGLLADLLLPKPVGPFVAGQVVSIAFGLTIA
jgi:hypothetical protein